MPVKPASVKTAKTTLGTILGSGLVRTVFQPIVDLESRRVFGFEALSRGPVGSTLEQADRLFAAARAEDLSDELDAACQAAALATAHLRGIRTPLTLFVNVEPDVRRFVSLPPVGRDIRGVVEITERMLTGRLPELLPAVQAARDRGWGIALDDVGADTRSLALMPLLRPDVIKLDLRLVQAQPTPAIAAIAGAVGAQAERTGATVVAEGIESEEQAQYARALGATLGQGFLLGRPAEDIDRGRLADVPLPIYSATLPYTWRTPFDLASARCRVRQGPIPLLAAISRELERHAAQTSRTALLISSFPDADRAIAHMTDAYELLATETAFAAAFATNMPPEPVPGVRGINIYQDDPVSGTWNVIVISAHYASMLAAKARPSESDAEPTFDFIFTYDRDVIVECAQALMLRIARLGTDLDDPA